MEFVRYVNRLAMAGLVAAGLSSGMAAFAQDSGYHVGEGRTEAPIRRAAPSPHRVARIGFTSGDVTVRSGGDARWTRASAGHALNEAGQVWVGERSRAEVLFDDGSILRLGNNSVVTLQTVYVDSQGDYTQIRMNRGIAMLEPRDERSVFEVNTPSMAVKTMGPSRVRVGAGDEVEVAVSRGRASLEGAQGKTTLNAGEFISQRADDPSYVLRSLPAADSWDRWNEDRDRRSASSQYPDRRRAPARSVLSIFLSLGFPIYGRDHREEGHWYGRGEYHRRL